MSSKSQNCIFQVAILQGVGQRRQDLSVRWRALDSVGEVRRRQIGHGRDPDTNLAHCGEIGQLIEPRQEIRDQKAKSSGPSGVANMDSHQMIAYVRHLAGGTQLPGEEGAQLSCPRVAGRRLVQQPCNRRPRPIVPRKKRVDLSVRHVRTG